VRTASFFGESERKNNSILFCILKAAWVLIFCSVSGSSGRGMLPPTQPVFTLLPPTSGTSKLSLPRTHRRKPPVLRDGRSPAQPNAKRCSPRTGPSSPASPRGLGARGPSQKPSLKCSPSVPAVCGGVACASGEKTAIFGVRGWLKKPSFPVRERGMLDIRGQGHGSRGKHPHRLNFNSEMRTRRMLGCSGVLAGLLASARFPSGG